MSDLFNSISGFKVKEYTSKAAISSEKNLDCPYDKTFGNKNDYIKMTSGNTCENRGFEA